MKNKDVFSVTLPGGCNRNMFKFNFEDPSKDIERGSSTLNSLEAEPNLMPSYEIDLEECLLVRLPLTVQCCTGHQITLY